MGRMRMGQGAGVMGQSRTPNGDRLAVFTGAVKRMESKEDGSLTATCQVDGHA